MLKYTYHKVLEKILQKGMITLCCSILLSLAYEIFSLKFLERMYIKITLLSQVIDIISNVDLMF